MDPRVKPEGEGVCGGAVRVMRSEGEEGWAEGYDPILVVIPVTTGIQCGQSCPRKSLYAANAAGWIPACAGMTLGCLAGEMPSPMAGTA